MMSAWYFVAAVITGDVVVFLGMFVITGDVVVVFETSVNTADVNVVLCNVYEHL